MMKDNSINHGSPNRRAFLKQAAAASLVGGVAMAGLRADPAHAADCSPDAGPRSLVCIFLAGGADSFNMFVPYDFDQAGSTHEVYARTRGNISVARANLLAVSDGSFGFHDQLPGLRSLYDNDSLAVISNVGPLARPTTPTDFAATRSIPELLFAHDAQQKLWQTGATIVGGYDGGWGGAISDQVAGCSGGAAVGPSVSARGSNIWLNNVNQPYLRLNPSAPMRRLVGYDSTLRRWLPSSAGLEQALEAVLADAETAESELEQVLGRSMRRTILTTEQLESVTLNNEANAVAMGDYGSNRLAQQLHLVARLIKAREQLSMSRQVFFVRMGGWDTHSNQNERFPPLLRDLNQAIEQFSYAMGPSGLDVSDSVTAFTASDFGRTLTSNGDATDHGWGGHSFVIGGAVRGGRYYGTIPNFSVTNNPDDIGTDRYFAGRLIPTTAVSQLGATLASWMGVDSASLDAMFPSLGNFSSRNLGFMS